MAREEAYQAFSDKIGSAADLKGNQFNFGTAENTFLRLHKEDDEENALYTDLLQLDMINLKKLTPYQPGRGYFIPVQMPRFMEQKFSDETKFFKTLLTTYCTNIDGISDLTLNFGVVSPGVESQEMDVATNVTGLTREITLQFPAELRGQFLTKYQYQWMTGINDPYTDRGRYHGADLPFTNANHTMSAVYFTLDPSETVIEFSCFIFNMMPKIAQQSINNKTRGENTPPEINIPYTSQLITGNKKITDKAYEYLQKINSMTYGVTSKFDRLRTG